MEDFILSLGKEIPADKMDDIVAIGDKRKIMKFCMRYADAKTTAKPKAIPKKVIPVPVKEEEE